MWTDWTVCVCLSYGYDLKVNYWCSAIFSSITSVKLKVVRNKATLEQM